MTSPESLPTSEREATKPKSGYQKMLHDNYHVGLKFGPVKDCPYCPREPKS